MKMTSSNPDDFCMKSQVLNHGCDYNNNSTVTITSTDKLIGILSNPSLKGKDVLLECVTSIKLNKFPTDGSDRKRIKDNFCPVKKYGVKYKLGTDYEEKMSEILGDVYESRNPNVTHLIPNTLVQYLSTGTICLNYIPTEYTYSVTILNDTEISDEDYRYMRHFLPKYSKSKTPVEYRTVNIKNVKSMTIDNCHYILDLK